jgi:RNA polymerase sigma-70 factor (ECF subfamily)
MDTQPIEPATADMPSPTAAPDDGLERARRGDLTAFRELLRANKARVFGLALRFMGRHADAEEVAQDVFLQLHGALRQIESSQHLKYWLLRAVSHRCIDRLRSESSRPRTVPLDALSESAHAAAPEVGGDPLAVAQVQRLLLQLAPEARAVVLLRFREDLDQSDIATVLAMPVNTVKSHLRRSLEWLRAQMAGGNHGY